MKLLFNIGGVLSFLAIADLPIGFYTFLRIYVTLVAGYMAYKTFKSEDEINKWVVAFSFIAILFNPIIPIYLYEKAIWMFINIGTGVLFFYSAQILTPIHKEQK